MLVQRQYPALLRGHREAVPADYIIMHQMIRLVYELTGMKSPDEMFLFTESQQRSIAERSAEVPSSPGAVIAYC